MIQTDVLLRALKREAERAPLRILKEAPRLKLAFFFEPTSDLTTSEEMELAQKMGEALKMPAGEWGVFAIPSSSWIEGVKKMTPDLAVFLGRFLGKFQGKLPERSEPNVWAHIGGTLILSVVHPREMLDEPNKKREVWKLLQEARQKMIRASSRSSVRSSVPEV